MNFEPIFGENNEIVVYIDDIGGEWTPREVEAYHNIFA